MDAIPTPLTVCSICGGPETEAQKLVQATSKGYPALLGYAEAAGNTGILDRIKEACRTKEVRYHRECKRDLFNKSVKAAAKSTCKYMTLYCQSPYSYQFIVVAAKAEKESVQTQRRRSSSASTGCSSQKTSSVQLKYKNVCILCNQAVDLFPNHPGETYNVEYY